MKLQRQLKAYLPAEIYAGLQEVGQLAAERGLSLYLIGGSVRDMLLQQDFDWDIDLVSDSPAVVELAQALARSWGGSLQTHAHYGTAKLRLGQLDLDFATARQEVYASPGAKPEIAFSSLKADLIRRDFTINAMAVNLLPERFGELYDPFGGVADLEQGQLKALHADKFIEDPVRAWRAVRLSTGLDFKLEPQTLNWLKAAMATGHFDGFFSERIRRELLKVLAKAQPAHYLQQLSQLGVLRCLSPVDFWDKSAEQLFQQLPHYSSWFKGAELQEAYFLGLITRLPAADREALLPLLQLSKNQQQALDTLLSGALQELPWAEFSPSQVVQQLQGVPELSLWILLAEEQPPDFHSCLSKYCQQWRFVQPLISGKILLEWMPPGPHIKLILQRLHAARLDGLLHTPAEALALAKSWYEEAQC